VRVKFHRLLEFDKNVHSSANKDHLRASVSIHNLMLPICSHFYMDLVSALNCNPHLFAQLSSFVMSCLLVFEASIKSYVST
jgi:hypothetical protein